LPAQITSLIAFNESFIHQGGLKSELLNKNPRMLQVS